jgi:hypothetical protein
LVIVALTLAWMLIAALGYLGAVFSLLEESFRHDKPPGAVLLILGAVTLVVPLILVVWAGRRHWLTWPILTGGGLAAGAVLVWLAWDDPVLRHPLTIAELAPAFDGAERSHAVILEYGKHHPTEESRVFSARKNPFYFTVGSPVDAEKWIAFLRNNRATIETEWTAAAPQRAWLDRLNAFDRLGDLTPADIGADIPRFDIWRFLAQRSCAIASLQALDGHGDEAIASLLPMLEVSRKFETSSRTLVRLMMARTAQRLCCQTGGFILDHAQPGPAARARLLAALEGGNGPAGARRIVLMEYAFFMPAFARTSVTEAATGFHFGQPTPAPRFLNLFTRLLFNVRATANLYGDAIYDLAALAEARDLGGFAVKQQAFLASAQRLGGMKNLGGRLLLNMSVPAYQKILQSYWETEDVRLALRQRLQTPPA